MYVFEYNLLPFSSFKLIKVSILQNCFEEPKAIAAEIAEVINAEVIQVIGKTIVFYKESSKKKQIVLPK